MRRHVQHVVAHDRTHLEPLVVDRQQHDAGLELAAADAIGDHRRVWPDEPYGDAGMAAQERQRRLVEAPGRRLAERADRDGAAPQRGELADAAGRVLDGAQAARGVLGERASRLGGHDAPPGADEEVGAERVLELADLLGDRRLRHPQRPRGGRERAELERRAEAADLLERQKLSFGCRQAVKPTLWYACRRSWRHDSRRGDRRRRDRRPRRRPGACATATSCCSRRATGSAAARARTRAATTGSTTAPTSSPRPARSWTRWRASAGWRPCR